MTATTEAGWLELVDKTNGQRYLAMVDVVAGIVRLRYSATPGSGAIARGPWVSCYLDEYDLETIHETHIVAEEYSAQAVNVLIHDDWLLPLDEQ